MIHLIDITFHTNTEYANTDALLKAQQVSLFYVDAVKNRLQIEVIKHVIPTTIITEKQNFRFFTGRNSRGHIPKETIAHLRAAKPQVVIVHGLSFPLQVIRLKMMFRRKTKIIAWHHAEQPPAFPKRILYKLADLCISKYFFTSKNNAKEWINTAIISGPEKIIELPPTLTVFSKRDVTACKKETGMENGIHYLWVGRLHAVKDPLTVIEAFGKFAGAHTDATLHMIFQTGELLEELERSCKNDNQIILHGAVANAELETWYSAADFCISSSLREAGSVTILEAMACGCIPIVSAIPASLKVTGDGAHGLNFPAGDVDGLADALIRSTQIDRAFFSAQVRRFFTKEFSVPAVADKLVAACELLARE